MASQPHVPKPYAAAAPAPVAVQIARCAASLQLAELPLEAIAKVKVCLQDLIGCAFEAAELPWSRQARALAERVVDGGSSMVGSAEAVACGDAAFANAVMGHGLVREDMHAGSISHLGIAVLPTVLALAESRRVSGADFIAAIVLGYEVGARIGRVTMDADVARIHRPTGITGPIAAAAAGSRLLQLTAEQCTSAVALGTNTTLGFNQWAHTGGSEMFFQAGFAARNAVSAVRLAARDAYASPTALDGEAGLFAALAKPDAGAQFVLFSAAPEILSVYHKPVPACNFAQTASLAAVQIARTAPLAPERIAAIRVRVPHAAARYPGCDASGPFVHILQGKMSIQYNVAAALIEGGVCERNFALLEDPRLQRLIGLTTLEIDAQLSAAYPGRQGAEVEVRTADGDIRRARLEDVVPATDGEVRERFREALRRALGTQRAHAIEAFVDDLQGSDDAGQLGRLLRGPPH